LLSPQSGNAGEDLDQQRFVAPDQQPQSAEQADHPQVQQPYDRTDDPPVEKTPAHSTCDRFWHGTGATWQVTGDVGDAQFMNSGYDLQVVGDRVYWVAASDGDRTVLRSVRVSGGRVNVRRLPGEYVLTAWPWLASSPGSTGTPVELYNVDTAVHRVVHAPANGYLTCAPVWCRMVVESRQDDTGIDIIRPDGTGRVRVGDADATAVTEDVALRGRFEVLAIGPPTSSPAIVIEQVRIFGLTRRRSVLIAPTASDAGA
jgi:hypothetical protein